MYVLVSWYIIIIVFIPIYLVWKRNFVNKIRITLLSYLLR